MAEERSGPSKNLRELIIVVTIVYLTVIIVNLFFRYQLSQFPIPIRLAVMVVAQWLLMLSPIYLMKKNGKTLADLGIHFNNLSSQILTGLVLGFLLSLIASLLPILLGYGNMLGAQRNSPLWYYGFELFYYIFGVALAEEFVFRGYLFEKLLAIKPSRWMAIIISSILFGGFHMMGGNPLQIIFTSLLGIIFCLCREKIASCTLISLIFMHGLHNFLIDIYVNLLT